MDAGDLSSLMLLALLLVSMVIGLIYTALTNIRPTMMREQAVTGNVRAQQVLDLVERLAQLNVTYQISQLLLIISMVAIATLQIAQPLVAAASLSPLVYAGVLALLALVMIIIGQLLPTTLGSAYAHQLALSLVPVARVWLLLFTPLVFVIMTFSKAFSALLGGDDLATSVTEEEIMTLVDAGQKEGTIDDEEKAMIFSVLQFGETLVREVMVPRMDIVAVEINTPLDVALGRFVESGHSRIPIYDDKIDNVEGLLYAKDVLTMWHNGKSKPQAIRELMRPAYFVPENNRADLVLKKMQASKIHMAIVVDEYGGTAGIVTIENLIEEIIGDIQDEYDIAEEADYTRHSDDEYTVDASIDLDDLNELLPIPLPTDDHDTLGGYIYAKVGRVPEEGEVIEDSDCRLTLIVKSVEGRRIRKVRLTINPPQVEPEDTEISTEEQRDEVG